MVVLYNLPWSGGPPGSRVLLSCDGLGRWDLFKLRTQQTKTRFEAMKNIGLTFPAIIFIALDLALRWSVPYIRV